MNNERVTAYLPISNEDIELFQKGKHYTSYKFLGAHLSSYQGKRGVNFILWAPNAQSISVIGDFNLWDGRNFQMKKSTHSNLWSLFISDINENDIYKYEIHTKDGEIKRKADPYGFYSEVRPRTASKVYFHGEYNWGDQLWLDKKEESYSKPLNIYELQLGSWSKKDNGELLNYREAAGEIIPYVLKMGYTHIELLPVMEHPFDGSWGYQITGYYSVTSRHGRPDDFKYFIDQCHQNNIGVILDWVPGHFCKDEHGLYRFDGSSLYEHFDNLIAENHLWGTATFDFGKPQVANFLISNAMFWFDYYHIDGLRVDAVSYMLYLDAGKENGQWRKNRHGGRENLEAIELIRNLNKTIFRIYPKALMIAEESTSWPLVTSPIHEGGLGFNYKWNMGWMNDMIKYMETEPSKRSSYHQLLTFSISYTYSENFILPLSHDEVVHGKKSLLDKMPGDYWQKFANLRLFYSYMYAHPGKKLLFMGGEFGQFIEWNYQRPLDWFLLDYEMHDKLHYFVKSLNSFYYKQTALYELDHQIDGFNWINHSDHQHSVFSFTRYNKADEFILAIFNFTPNPHHQYKMGVPQKGLYKEIFNSDYQEYGGSGIKNKEKIKALKGEWHNQSYYIELDIPPLGAIFLK